MTYPITKTKPWKHQIKAWELSKNQPAFYYALDMGTGKSKCAIDHINGKDCKLVLIICPYSVIPVWPRQFETHSGNKFNVITLPNTKSTIAKKIIKIKQQLDDAIISNTRAALILNYEAYWREPLGPITNPKGVITAPGLLMSYRWDALILDEAHRIKSPGGKASWFAKRLAYGVPRKLWLSGTPFPHSPLDIYAQFRALAPKIYGTNFVQFRQQYCVMGGYEMKQVIQWKNLDELNKKFYSVAYRVKKEDVLDLPPATDADDREFDLCPAARRIYNEFERDFFAEIIKSKALGTPLKISASNSLTKMLRLTQMTAGIFQLDDGRRMYLDDGKLNEIKEILTDLPEEEPVVIACRFKPELQRAKDLCQKLGRTCAELSGNINQLDDWQNGKYNCLAVNIRSGREGIDLTRACYVIFSSTGLSLGDIKQFRDRFHRPGQTRPVTYFHIIAKKSVDTKIRKALIKREQIVESVLEDISSQNP